jgi:hypothetical protein
MSCIPSPYTPYFPSMSKAAAQGMGGLLKYYDRTAAWPAALNIVETGMAAPSSTRRVVHERAQRRCEYCTAMNDAAIVSRSISRGL